jgi:predicted DNA-binding mobile mystery protein A
MMKRGELVREQLDATLAQLAPLRRLTPPPKGWIRAIRDALGMTARQLARRIGVAQQAVARIEKDEQTGSVTIKTMRRVAEGLDCEFVFGFVPRSRLEDAVRKQAARLAAARFSRASQTMTLEDQELSRAENQKVLAAMVDEIAAHAPRALWEEP